MATTATTHSNDFEKLKECYEINYITVDQLRRWVAINARRSTLGITAAEFTEITGLPYEA